ncbi:ABC transporter permease [Bacillus aquiflavi]|uniref:ABC transporter permease n=1 Tax=Bacillus aquiflavi TaxID=2672567 RepID=A0A6B3W1A4_9BACI|nr:ABC transporter permease [Bacillus aquiflavi]MBA4537991.1 ABC transporter permease [Bacillus aquiflavi]NEY82247.1 ABC transporter permease [Bacillus aquiflavi]
MRQWSILLNKEILEMWRSFKWIWVPMTFILLGMMDPLTSYYMPQILDAVGDLPEGTIIEIPTPSAQEVLMMTVNQFNIMGVLVIVLLTMGLISAERKSGVAGMILVKPVSVAYYVTAKWTGALLLLLLSYFLGFLASWYYVGILFEPIPFGDFFIVFMLYGIWLIFVLTVSLFFNAMLKSPGAVAFTSLSVIIILNLVGGLLSHWLKWSPSQLSVYAGSFLTLGELPDEITGTVLISFILIVMLLIFSVFIFRKKELAT